MIGVGASIWQMDAMTTQEEGDSISHHPCRPVSLIAATEPVRTAISCNKNAPPVRGGALCNLAT